MLAQPSASERSALLRASFILGIGLGILQSIVWILSMPLTPGITSTPSFVAFIFLVSPIIWIICFFCLGFWVGKRTGDIGQATKNGLFSGIFAGLLASISHILIMTLSLSNATGSQPLGIAWEAVGIGLETMLLATGSGTIFGFVGGYVGQYISSVVPQTNTHPVNPAYAQPSFFYPQPPVMYAHPLQPNAAPPFQPNAAPSFQSQQSGMPAPAQSQTTPPSQPQQQRTASAERINPQPSSQSSETDQA